MDFFALKNEITNDPSALGYSGKTDQEVADLLNARNINRVGSAEISKVLVWAGKHGAFKKLEAHTSDPEPIGNICDTAIRMFGSVQNLDLGDSDVTAMLGGLVSAGVITQQDADDLIAVATTKISRAEQLDLSEVGAGDVNHARAI